MPDISLRMRLLRLGVAVFFSYLSVAVALPVISVHVGRELGLSNWLGGLAVGVSFLSTILSRKYAGSFADLRSPKRCAILGLGLYMLAAAICLASLVPRLPAPLAYAVLVCGRLVLGLGESMALVGITSWHFSLIGPTLSGKILSIVGMAMYGAFAVGGPVGLEVYARSGFPALMLLSFLFPLAGAFLLIAAPDVPPRKASSMQRSFAGVMRMIWKQGTVVCLQGVGFAVLGAFVSLYFKSRAWPYAGLGLTCFGSGFVLIRILFGGLPDRIGGIRLARFSLIVEAAGQALLWLAPNVSTALAGALLTGLGCSMIFPAMGVEVVRRVPAELRATAFGGFAAFQDVAYAFSAPVAGALADVSGYPAVFLLGAAAAVLGLAVTASMPPPARREG